MTFGCFYYHLEGLFKADLRSETVAVYRYRRCKSGGLERTPWGLTGWSHPKQEIKLVKTWRELCEITNRSKQLPPVCYNWVFNHLPVEAVSITIRHSEGYIHSFSALSHCFHLLLLLWFCILCRIELLWFVLKSILIV